MKKITGKYDAVIVGGGPAGLAAAIGAASAGASVLLLEQMPQPGRKLLATGGGRCNLTNRLGAVEMSRAFGGRMERFVKPAIQAFPPEKLRGFFTERGVKLAFPDDFHCFPASGKAGDILETLLAETALLGVEICCNTRVQELLTSDGRVSGVVTGRGKIASGSVIIAAGGRSYPVLGANGGGYPLAAMAGHTVVEQFPGMVGLRTVEKWPGDCRGIALPDVSARIDLPGEKQLCRGDLLFTHHGISAFAVLDISARAAQLLAGQPEIPLRLDLFPDISVQEWQRRFQEWQQNSGSRPVASLLTEYLPKKLVPILLPAGASSVIAARFGGAMRKELIGTLKGLLLHINGTEGWEKAQVTRGGVALDEVSPKDLASRRLPGLFFAGEVLDIDGPCGGYNLQWAFSSGIAAGAAAAGFCRKTAADKKI